MPSHASWPKRELQLKSEQRTIRGWQVNGIGNSWGAGHWNVDCRRLSTLDMTTAYANIILCAIPVEIQTAPLPPDWVAFGLPSFFF